jgi:hypothetical protein
MIITRVLAGVRRSTARHGRRPMWLRATLHILGSFFRGGTSRTRITDGLLDSSMPVVARAGFCAPICACARAFSGPNQHRLPCTVRYCHWPARSAAGGNCRAEPDASSPKGLVILGPAFVSTLVSGLGLAVWLDRRDTGFHDQRRCWRAPACRPRHGAAAVRPDCRHPVAGQHGHCASSGRRGGETDRCRGPEEGGNDHFRAPAGKDVGIAAGLAKVLVFEGQRLRLVAALSQLQLEDGALSLEEVLADGQELWAAHYGAPSYAQAILADRNVRVDCLGVEANAIPTSAPHHSALTGQSQRGAPQKSVQARFHATTNECCEGKKSAGRYKAICS